MLLGYRVEKLDGVSAAGVIPPVDRRAREQALDGPVLRFQDALALLFPVVGVGIDRIVVKAHCVNDVDERVEPAGQAYREPEGVVALRGSIVTDDEHHTPVRRRRA